MAVTEIPAIKKNRTPTPTTLSSAAHIRTSCGTFQLAGVNTRVLPTQMVISILPDPSRLLKVTAPVGGPDRRTLTSTLPPSGTRTLVGDTMTDGSLSISSAPTGTPATVNDCAPLPR